MDALFCAAPNHWHGPATILACDAGKHVYVEKPCSHNPWEGEQMIAAARKLATLCPVVDGLTVMNLQLESMERILRRAIRQDAMALQPAKAGPFIA